MKMSKILLNNHLKHTKTFLEECTKRRLLRRYNDIEIINKYEGKYWLRVHSEDGSFPFRLTYSHCIQSIDKDTGVFDVADICGSIINFKLKVIDGYKLLCETEITKKEYLEAISQATDMIDSLINQTDKIS